MIKPAAGYRSLAYSSPETVQTTGTGAHGSSRRSLPSFKAIQRRAVRFTKETAQVLGFNLGERPALFVQSFPKGLEILSLAFRFERLRTNAESSSILLHQVGTRLAGHFATEGAPFTRSHADRYRNTSGGLPSNTWPTVS